MAENTTSKATTKWKFLRDEMDYALRLIFKVVSEGVKVTTKEEQVVFELQQDVPEEVKALGAVRHRYGKFILFVPDVANVSNPSSQADYAGIINDKIESLFEEYAVASRPRLSLQRYTVTLKSLEVLSGLNTVEGYICEVRLHYMQTFKKHAGG